MSRRTTVFVTANPEGREQLIDLLRADAAAAPQEPGNVRFVVNQDILDPNRLVICEQWASQEALDEHMEHDHYKAVMAAFEDTDLITEFSLWTMEEDA